MSPLESARCAWEVTAGLLPGETMPEHTRRWGLSSDEWDGGKGYELFLQREALATAYARYLQELCAGGREVNWTRLDFVWF
jgi:hypothetical protein